MTKEQFDQICIQLRREANRISEEYGSGEYGDGLRDGIERAIEVFYPSDEPEKP